MLETCRLVAYTPPMSDPTNRPIADLIADIDASEAEIERGELVPGGAVLAKVQAAIERLEAQRRRGEPHRAQLGR